MKAQLPDGTILEFPDGTDPAVIQSTVKKMISQSQAQTIDASDRDKYIQEVNQDMGPLETGLVAAGRGLTSIGRGLGLADPEAPEVTRAFENLEEQRPVSTFVGEVAGQSAPFLVPGLGQAGLAARLGGGAMARGGTAAGLGALEAGIISKGEGGSSDEQKISAGIGGFAAGTMELVLPSVGRKLGKVYRRVMGKAPDGSFINPTTGEIMPEFREVLKREGISIEDLNQEALKELSELDPQQVARQQFFKANGLRPTRAQITRDATDFQLQEEAAKTSGRVRDLLESQDAILTTRFDNEVLKTGGKANSEVASVFDAVTAKATVLDQRISDLYDAARQVSGSKKNIRFNNLSQKLRELAPDNEVTGGAIKSILGTLDQGGSVKKFKPRGSVDVLTAEKVRKKMNALYDPKNPQRNMALRELKDALDDDVFKAQGRDIFQEARKAKVDFEGELARAKVSKFDDRRANLVRDILENKVDPDRLVDTVVVSKKWRSDDIRQLKDYIKTTEQGAKAFDDLRAETLNYIKDNAMRGPEDAQGMRRITRDGLTSALDRIGVKKRRVIFTADENKFLDDMVKIASLREPVRGTAMGRGPSAQAIARLEQKLKDLPMLGGILDFIDLDINGRAVIKATPAKKITAPLPSPARSAAGVAGVAAIQGEEDK